MVIEIRGFNLPSLLEKLINDGIWIPNYESGTEIPQELLFSVGIKEHLIVVLCDLDDLKSQNTESAWDGGMDDEEFAKCEADLGWASSKRTGKLITDTTKLDVSKAVLIAYNEEDDIVCLDYRLDAENPQVVVRDWANKKWCVIAPDFDTFAKKLGLAE